MNVGSVGRIFPVSVISAIFWGRSSRNIYGSITERSHLALHIPAPLGTVWQLLYQARFRKPTSKDEICDEYQLLCGSVLRHDFPKPPNKMTFYIPLLRYFLSFSFIVKYTKPYGDRHLFRMVSEWNQIAFLCQGTIECCDISYLAADPKRFSGLIEWRYQDSRGDFISYMFILYIDHNEK